MTVLRNDGFEDDKPEARTGILFHLMGGQRELPGSLAERVLDRQTAVLALEVDAIGGKNTRLDWPGKAVPKFVKVFLELCGILLG